MATLKASLAKAVQLHNAGRMDDARAAYIAHLDQFPNDATAWSNLGALFRATKAYADALRAQRCAFAIDPRAPAVRINLANILSDIGDYDASLELRREMLTAAPDDANQKAMIGRCLRGQGKFTDAVDWLNAAAADHPQNTEVRLQLAFAQLAAGDYGPAFDNYRVRWQGAELSPRKLPWPEWSGEPLAGKTIAVLPEQGFGDTVMFARFLPRLKALGARTLFVVKPPLQRVFQDLPGADWIGSEIPKAESVDYWINTIDLATIDLKSPADIPAPAQLHIPHDSQERAAEIVTLFKGKLRVGVVWSGSSTYKGNAFRSFSHRDFLPLASLPNVQLFSLYKGPYLEAMHSDGSAAFIRDAAGTDRDFADCAATMQQMDVIVTSDTATAHIAGSLGLPTWVVLHWDPFWVYGHAGDTTPWYPSMRLYRKKQALNWAVPLENVAEDLAAIAQNRKA